MRAAVVRAIAGSVLALTLGACTGLPEAGPVVDADVDSRVDDERASDLNAVPPAANASASEVVKGFLDAMTASPIRLDVARQFLSVAAAAEWDPEASTITYADKLPARALSGTQVMVSLSDAELLDRTGAWQGELPDSRQELDFQLTIEGGEFRIENPPDALVVPAPWFSQRFRQASLYFFEPSGRVLAPQPVYVPRGSQLATSLIEGLLSGPSSRAGTSVRSFIPPDLSAGLSVPVSNEGVADIALGGELGNQNTVTIERMLAQFAWTLRQEPSITSLRVTVGGQPVRGADGDALYDVTDAQQFGPSGATASSDIYALVGGLLAVRAGNELLPTAGPFGTRRFGLRSVAVSLDASRAAAVSADGRRLTLASSDGPADATQPTTRPISGATDLLRPRWDLADRVWVVDRTSSGAVVRYVDDRRVRTIDVPGVS
ncbi:MAG: LpqB family beta-propeller domain-containing protein, partial [Nocardioides sp.]